MRHSTKTKDEQDLGNPYKPFPPYEYFDVLHWYWEHEPFLFIEKSRTMMVSWFAAAEALHMVMTRQPGRVIFWAQDEDRAVGILNYTKTLYDQQDEWIKQLFPLARPLSHQSYKELEFSAGSSLAALPGKDPQKIRSEHPTVLIMDEACFIENGGEAFDVAISSRVQRVMVVSSAAPSWFRRMTKPAVPVPLPAIEHWA